MATFGQESPELCTFRHHSVALIHAIDCPDVFAWQLAANGIISNETKNQALILQLSKEQKNSILLLAVEGKIRAEPSVFHRFTDLLVADGDQTLKTVGDRMRDDAYGRAMAKFASPNPTPADLEGTRAPQQQTTYRSRGMRVQTDATLEIEIPQPLAAIPESPENRLETFSEDEKFQIALSFAQMFAKLASLLSRVLSIDHLKFFLQTLADPVTQQPYIHPAVFQHCKSTEQLLQSLHPSYIHALHLELLKGIVEFSESDESKMLLSRYESMIPYSMHLSQLESPLTDEQIKACRNATTVRVIIDGDLNSFSVQDVEKIKYMLHNATGVNNEVIVYSKHQRGSVILTFLVPDCTAEHFISIGTDDAKLSAFASTNVVRIEVDKCIIDVPKLPSVLSSFDSMEPLGLTHSFSFESGFGSTVPSRVNSLDFGSSTSPE